MRWFAVVSDGSLWSVTQRCPDAVRGACKHAGACECSPDADGPLWLCRGSGLPRDEAVSRASVLDARFDVYVREWAARQVPKPVAVEVLPVVAPERAAFVVVVAPPLWEVWRVCGDVLAVGECRSALWCSCVHSDAGPLRARVAVFESEADAEARRALLQSEVAAWRRGGFDASLFDGVRVPPLGVSRESAARSAELDSWSSDVPY